jgi:hypothetical protein
MARLVGGEEEEEEDKRSFSAQNVRYATAASAMSI